MIVFCILSIKAVVTFVSPRLNTSLSHIRHIVFFFFVHSTSYNGVGVMWYVPGKTRDALPGTYHFFPTQVVGDCLINPMV